MSQTEHEQSAQERSERERPQQERPANAAPASPAAAPLELLTLLAAGVADLAFDQLRQTADRAQHVMRRSDLKELLTDGVVELRKRGEVATRRAGVGAENYLETMARRAAERVAAEGHSCA
ncbi:MULTISPECIES: hypothetical protein [unclassified Streptomyces]|uniref:hypothetical protein n=1 Tax=unclassified Streptomyces TaxID=2593676 RepID=UPI002254AF52|nr:MULTISPECIES: hypothetical protein [unclassified Streptomyces]MCX5010567.1 hypothetical protein [Streptomyces sp. NBC_00555]MCX5610999.1 hypothetical protein [Streptomyces sp. NBC_00047]